MTEQQPRQIDLTTRLAPSKLERRGDIFMPGEPGRQEVPVFTPKTEAPRVQATEQPFNREQLDREWASWLNTLDPKQRTNPDTLATIRAASELGISPFTVKGKGPDAPQAREVVANSTLLSDEDRIAKAQEKLGRELSFDEREALKKAHNTGVGVFKNSPEQIMKKGGILKREGGFSKEDIHKLITSGLVAAPERRTFKPSSEWQEIPEGVAIPPGATIKMNMTTGKNEARWDTPPDIEVEYMFTPSETAANGATSGTTNIPEASIDLETAKRIVESAGLNTENLGDDATLKLATELSRRQTAQGVRGEVSSSYAMYLSDADRGMLDNGQALEWLESKFDMIYSVSAAGQEVNSPIVGQLQQIFTFASNYLAERKANPKDIEAFNTSFLTRLNLIFMRSAVDHRAIDQAKEMSMRLQASGMLTALAMEGGGVHKMFSRMAELIEDKRLAQTNVWKKLMDPNLSPAEREKVILEAKQFHITAEMMSRLQDDLIEEQYEQIAKKGIGDFGLTYNKAKAEGKSEEQIKEAVQSQIRRAVRTAYDVMVVSQRQGVIVARGHRLPGHVENYLSDPAGLFNVFNHEDLLTEKFNIYNKHAAEFLRELKLNMARSKLGTAADQMSEADLLDYGQRKFRDLFAVADFFSSSWRILGIRQSIEQRLAWESRELPEGQKLDKNDLALFFQLKQAGENVEKRAAVWGRIAEIRPEEIIRLYRERANGNVELTAKLEEFFEGDVFREFRKEPDGTTLDGFKTYDKFKKEFGPLIQILRQQGYDKFTALRIGKDGFTSEQIKIINAYFGGSETDTAIGEQKAKMLQAMFAQMSSVGSQEATITFLNKHNKFEDAYTRVLVVYDALLDKIEKTPEGSDIIAVSKFWTSEVGADALRRNYGDLENATKAAGNLLKFIYTEDPKERIKAGEEFAEFNSQYNGQGGRAEALRYTVGSLLDMSKQDFIWDAIGVSKLPFRKSMSRIEEIYGPQVNPMSRDELRMHVDELHSMMVASIDRVGKTPEEIEEAELKAEAVYHDLERLLEITSGDMLKRRAASFLVQLLAIVFAEGVNLGKNVANGK